MSAQNVPEKLQAWFAAHPRFVLAFSGGCDSAYLFYAATVCGADFAACYVKSAFQPEFELEDARRLAKELGREIDIIELDVLADEKVRANPKNRCYFCKQRIFSVICDRARALGHDLVIDGTNASDDADDRPGMRALRELEVRSPLRECGLTKAEIRAQSKKAGLFTWNKPAYACLATRIPTGTAITAGDLERVEAAEGALFALGFTDFRVRLLSGAARIQLPADQWDRASEQREAIRKALSPRFDAVLLDLETR